VVLNYQAGESSLQVFLPVNSTVDKQKSCTLYYLIDTFVVFYLGRGQVARAPNALKKEKCKLLWG